MSAENENETETFDPAAEADAEGLMIDESDEDAGVEEAENHLTQAAAAIVCVVVPVACVNERKGAPLGMGIQRWWAQELGHANVRAAAPVFTAMTERNGQQVPALMIYGDPWTSERAWEGVSRFPNAKTALLSELHAAEDKVALTVRLADVQDGALVDRRTWEVTATAEDIPSMLQSISKDLREELGAEGVTRPWEEAFGTSNVQACLSFLVGLGNLSALQGRVVPSTSDQLLNPLVDAVNRDPEMDIAMDALHAMVEILVGGQPDRTAVPLSVQALQIAAQRRPQDREVFHHLALLVRRLGDLPASVNFFNQAFNLDPTDVRIAANFIETLRRVQDTDNALKVAQFAIERGCDGPVVLAQLGSLLIERDDFDGAEPFLRRAVDEGKVPSAYGDLANVLWDRSSADTDQGREDRAEALRLLKTASELDRVAKSTLDMLLDLHEESGEAAALELLLAAADSHQDQPAVQISVANAYLDGDDPSRARPYLERVLNTARRSLDDDAFARRQLLALQIEDFDDRYDTAAKNAQSPEPARRAATAVFMREVIATDPLYWQPHMMLGLSVRASDGDVAALGHLNDAVRLRPNDPSLRAILATLLKQMGRPREAVEHLRLQVSLQPREVTPVITLAATMRDANLFDEARSVCQSALQMLPNHPEFTKILNSLPPAKNA